MRTKEDPRQILLSKFGVLPEDIAAMDEKQLRKMVRDHRRAAKEKSNLPDRSSPSWPDYVMTLFDKKEMEGGNPRLEGLRRVTRLVLGPILAERCEVVSPPSMDNGYLAVARASITIMDRELGRETIHEAAADASIRNCAQDFANYSTAMADTRARGRAFRSALGLHAIAAEEAGTTSACDGQPMSQSTGSEAIRIGQISNIRLMADRVKVSVPALLKLLEMKTTEVKELTHQESLVVIKKLNEFQQTGQIPTEVRCQAQTDATT